MRTLSESFEKSGWKHQQIVRQGNYAIYKRWKESGLDPHYEVVRIRSHNGFKIPGTEEKSEPAEFYPTETTWGRDGFTCHTFNEALDKIRALTEEK